MLSASVGDSKAAAAAAAAGRKEMTIDTDTVITIRDKRISQSVRDLSDWVTFHCRPNLFCIKTRGMNNENV